MDAHAPTSSISTSTSASGQPPASRPSSNFSSKKDLQKHYIASARDVEGHTDVKICASSKDYASAFGVGVGLYLKVLVWLKWMFAFMMVVSVPFLVVINNCVFTDSVHKDSFEYGVAVYPQLELSSFTFGAIVSSSMDNNTLAYMNVDIANKWDGPMSKSDFLIWVSYVDACASFVLLLAIMAMGYAAHRFCISVDRACLEVADFTVLVQGLPKDATPQEIGEHFCRFGEVVETQLVLDLGWTLGACQQVQHLEQKMQHLQDCRAFCKPEVFQARSRELEQRLQQSVSRVNARLAKQPLPAKVAFVTFNDLGSVKRCLEACPKGWLCSLLQPRAERLRGTQRFWVSQASPPEDYFYENLSISKASRGGRKVLTRLAVVLILLASAAIITGLSNFNTSNANTVAWQAGRLVSDTRAAVAALPVYDNATAAAAASLNLTTVCTATLAGTCTAHFNATLGASLQMSFGSLLSWTNFTEGLLYLRPTLQALQAAQATLGATAAGAAAPPTPTPYAACYPCFCLGLQQSNHPDDPTWRSEVTAECATYVDSYDLPAWGLSLAIALVITCLNLALKYALEYLLAFEKHWTRSGLEWWYGAMAFAAQFLNSAVVLLLVNCAQLRDASSSLQEQGSTFLQHVLMNGSFSDFERMWYETVGKAIFVLVFIHIFNPITSLLCDLTLRSLARCRLRCCVRNDLQHRYREVFARPNFSLQERVADVMLLLTLALMFGTGIPLLYLAAFAGMIVQNLVDRYACARICHVSSRYAQHLPLLIINWLPWALLMHCAFSLWMLTYFSVGNVTDLSSVVLGSGVTVLDRFSADSDSSNGSSATTSQRITQANGIAMLLVTALVAAWILWRYFLSFLRDWLRRALCLLATKLHAMGRFRDLQLAPGYRPESELQETYTHALHTGALQGAPTYRIHHHPAYSCLFANSVLTKAVFYKAMGTNAYTRLLCCGHSGALRVSSDVCTKIDTSDLELATHQISESLSYLVRDLSVSSPKASPLRGTSSQPRGAPSQPGMARSTPAAVRILVIVDDEGQQAVPPTAPLASAAQGVERRSQAPTQHDAAAAVPAVAGHA